MPTLVERYGAGLAPAEDMPGATDLATAPPPPGPDRLLLRPVAWADLSGFAGDDLADASLAIRRSCGVWNAKPAAQSIDIGDRSVLVGDWQEACRALRTAGDDTTRLRETLTETLEPFAAINDGRFLTGRWNGLFTGYYEPRLYGSRKRSARYRVPLYLRPPDLTTIDLSAFRAEWKGLRLGGRFSGGSFVPYHDRQAIDRGALAARGLELVFVDDPVDAFFLHIQGSGRITLDEGGELRVGYAAQNGLPYVAIGKVLIERGELTRETVSMQAIRRWLAANPDRAEALLHENPSYVFFRHLDSQQLGSPGDDPERTGPLGSQGVPLTPGRSLAVDRTYMPLGTLVFVDGLAPGANEGDPDRSLRRLLVAQDTGGAIKGPLRGDVFFGHGADAAEVAGRMRHRGRLWLLLPRGSQPVADRLAPIAE